MTPPLLAGAGRMPGGSGWDTPMYRPEWYNHSDLHTAWGLLIDAAEATTGGGCVVAAPSVYDIVDVGREYLSVATCPGRYDALVKAATPGSIKVGHVTS